MRTKLKRLAAVWLAAALLATALAGVGPTAQASSGAIGVGQAIANNAGIATVEGFIVAQDRKSVV